MNILAVDTAGKTAGVALLQDDRLLYEVYLDGGMTHSETLMPMIDTCLKMCGISVSLWVMPASRYTSYSRRSSCKRATPAVLPAVSTAKMFIALPPQW